MNRFLARILCTFVLMARLVVTLTAETPYPKNEYSNNHHDNHHEITATEKDVVVSKELVKQSHDYENNQEKKSAKFGHHANLHLEPVQPAKSTHTYWLNSIFEAIKRGFQMLLFPWVSSVDVDKTTPVLPQISPEYVSTNGKENSPQNSCQIKELEHKYLIEQWRDYEKNQEKRYTEIGRHADLFLQPARPPHASYSRSNQVINLNIRYNQATDGYSDSGALASVAKTSFTRGGTSTAIRLQDLLLASKLVNLNPQAARHRNDKVNDATGNVLPMFAHALANDAYLGYLGNKTFSFSSNFERIEAGFSMSHYFFTHRIGVGLFIPVVQDKRRLTLSLSSAIEDVTQASMAAGTPWVIALAGGGGADAASNAAVPQIPTELAPFNLRYGNSTTAFINDLFAAKGINGFGGTSTGLGDVQVYAQAKLDSAYLDQALINMRLIVPTAPQTSTDKLWGPELGNGGFYQTGLSFTAVGRYNRFCNPHFYVEGMYSFPAVVQTRVPKIISLDGTQASLNTIPLGYRLDPIAAGVVPYNGYDVVFRNMSDSVSSLKIAKGLMFDLRLGNIFEHVFMHRAFLDIFYNFKIKATDLALGLPASNYHLALYELGSGMHEHRVGAQWRLQLSKGRSLNLAVEQVIAGRSTSQDTQISASISYGF